MYKSKITNVSPQKIISINPLLYEVLFLIVNG